MTDYLIYIGLSVLYLISLFTVRWLVKDSSNDTPDMGDLLLAVVPVINISITIAFVVWNFGEWFHDFSHTEHRFINKFFGKSGNKDENIY